MRDVHGIFRCPSSWCVMCGMEVAGLEVVIDDRESSQIRIHAPWAGTQCGECGTPMLLVGLSRDGIRHEFRGVCDEDGGYLTPQLDIVAVYLVPNEDLLRDGKGWS